ncbi:MAG: putative branched-subunit amino acid permease [Parasphingorhabdus sp.]
MKFGGLSAELFSGAKDSVPVVFSAAPFGVLFGALAVENGMSITEAVWMSALLFAGASQMVGIELFGQVIPAWIIVLSIFAVNFRHVLYSAAIGRHLHHFPPLQRFLAFFFLTDPLFAETELKVLKQGRVSMGWYFGYALPLYFSWIVEAYIGAYFGVLIMGYSEIGIDFFLPIYFLGLVMSFRQRNNWFPVVIASAIASIVAWHTVGSPWHVSIGAIAGVVVAALIYRPTPIVVQEKLE